MKKEEYLKLVDNLTPKPNKLKNCLYAFLSGAIIGASAEILRLIIYNTFKSCYHKDSITQTHLKQYAYQTVINETIEQN